LLPCPQPAFFDSCQPAADAFDSCPHSAFFDSCPQPAADALDSCPQPAFFDSCPQPPADALDSCPQPAFLDSWPQLVATGLESQLAPAPFAPLEAAAGLESQLAPAPLEEAAAGFESQLAPAPLEDPPFGVDDDQLLEPQVEEESSRPLFAEPFADEAPFPTDATLVSQLECIALAPLPVPFAALPPQLEAAEADPPPLPLEAPHAPPPPLPHACAPPDFILVQNVGTKLTMKDDGDDARVVRLAHTACRGARS
jgi:hypothetical protein